MAEKLLMIALSPTMAEGRIARWKKAEGEAFGAGATLLEVETDKASMDYEAPRAGTLLKILVAEGATAAVGDPIAIVGKAGEDISSLLASSAAPARAAAPAAPSAAPPAQAPALSPSAPPSPLPSSGAAFAGPSAPASYPPSSPLARSLARERGIDVRGLRGSGPGGRVVRRDVEAASRASPAAPRDGVSRRESAQPGAAPTRAPVTPMRAAIARRLSASYNDAPHFYLRRRVAAQALLDLRAASAAGREKPVSLNALLIKLSASALSRHPEINVAWGGDAIEARSAIDISLAVALPGGLITPVVRDCARKGVLEIEGELSALIAKAKEGALAPPEYEGAGFTISNLGAYGVEDFTAIINPPASAILAVGAIADEACARPDGGLFARKAMTLTLGCDHRAIDGAVGAAFLATLALFVEDPGRALL